MHYIDVIMGAMASRITSLTIVYSTVYSGADQRKHQSSASLAFVRGIHRGPVNSPHKWPVTRKMFPFDDATMGTFGRFYSHVSHDVHTGYWLGEAVYLFNINNSYYIWTRWCKREINISVHSTHPGIVTPYGVTELVQHQFRLPAWRHQIITRTKAE